MYWTGTTGNGRSPYRADSWISPGGMTLGPWLVSVLVAAPTVTLALEERSRQTSVGRALRVAALLSSTRVLVEVAATGLGDQVTVLPLPLTVAPLPAAVNWVPVGAVTTTWAPDTGLVPVLVSRIREG